MRRKTFPKSIIFEIILNLKEKYHIKILCKYFQVSISGYYKHRKLILTNNTKEEREKENLKLIEKIVGKKKINGYRMVTMKVNRTKEGKSKGIVFNHKRVYRLMKKYNLLSKIRRKNPYKSIIKDGQEHKIKKNILNRDFSGTIPLTKFGTDITYLYYKGNKGYLSMLKDMITGEIVGYEVSNNLGLGFVIETIEQGRDKIGSNNLNECIIHSDQGVHYTSPYYQSLLKDYGIIQSMSRRGNCLDNAPTESFFGHMKDEITHDLKQIKTKEELEKYIDNYIFYYNNKRPQWNRKKMTPVEYRNHLLSLS